MVSCDIETTTKLTPSNADRDDAGFVWRLTFSAAACCIIWVAAAGS